MFDHFVCELFGKKGGKAGQVSIESWDELREIERAERNDSYKKELDVGNLITAATDR